MSKPPLLTPEEINKALDELNIKAQAPWQINEGKMLRRYDFKTFSDAFGFMTQAALACEKLDHHPRWVNVYNVVEISLFTFRVKGLTRLDFDLAGRLEALANKLLASPGTR